MMICPHSSSSLSETEVSERYVTHNSRKKKKKKRGNEEERRRRWWWKELGEEEEGGEGGTERNPLVVFKKHQPKFEAKANFYPPTFPPLELATLFPRESSSEGECRGTSRGHGCRKIGCIPALASHTRR